MNTFYGFKIGQDQAYDTAGKRIPVTLVRVNPAVIVGAKTVEKDGYNAIKIALGFKKHLNKPLQGLLKNVTEKISPQYFKEIKTPIESGQALPENQTSISVGDVFTAGDKVKVTGTSKGKGFSGVVKRHGFKGGPKTHGQSNRQRHPGSIGSTTTPGRVLRGKRMAGHMGNVKSTIKNLSVFAISPEENLIKIKGLIPGPKGSLVKISK